MSDREVSDEEQVLSHDPMMSDAVNNESQEVPNLRDELVQSYGDGVLDDDHLTINTEMASVFEDGEEQPIDYSRSPHPLFESESDDEAPVTKNPLRNLINDAKKVVTRAIMTVVIPKKKKLTVFNFYSKPIKICTQKLTCRKRNCSLRCKSWRVATTRSFKRLRSSTRPAK
jgi:hypothetical protein